MLSCYTRQVPYQIIIILDSKHTRSTIGFCTSVQSCQASTMLIKTIQQRPLRSYTKASWQIRPDLSRVRTITIQATCTLALVFTHTCSAIVSVNTGTVSGRRSVSSGAGIVGSCKVITGSTWDDAVYRQMKASNADGRVVVACWGYTSKLLLWMLLERIKRPCSWWVVV